MKTNFNKQAKLWHTDDPRHYGDFAGRPEAIKLLRKLGRNKIIIDLGCGEGYLTRKIVKFAKEVVGVDQSREMISLAKQRKHNGIEYCIADVLRLPYDNSTFEVCFGSYVTNYIHPDRLPDFYKEMNRILFRNGKFIILMPHPVLRLLTDFGEALTTKITDYDYFGSRGKFFNAFAQTVSGDILQVGLYHQTYEDHINSIVPAGLKISEVRPIIFPKKIALKYSIFSKLDGKVVGLLLSGYK